jgi:acyl carrier protein
MTDSVEQGCVQIFREVTGLETHDDSRLLAEPLDALDLDSLTLLEFVMHIEDTYNVELNEESVRRCRNLGELITLVAAEEIRSTGKAKVTSNSERPPRISPRASS